MLTNLCRCIFSPLLFVFVYFYWIRKEKKLLNLVQKCPCFAFIVACVALVCYLCNDGWKRKKTNVSVSLSPPPISQPLKWTHTHNLPLKCQSEKDLIYIGDASLLIKKKNKEKKGEDVIFIRYTIKKNPSHHKLMCYILNGLCVYVWWRNDWMNARERFILTVRLSNIFYEHRKS